MARFAVLKNTDDNAVGINVDRVVDVRSYESGKSCTVLVDDGHSGSAHRIVGDVPKVVLLLSTEVPQ